MKRLFGFLLILVLLACSACMSRAGCVEERADGGYQIRLPLSGQVLKLQETYEAYLPYVTDERIREAEEKIAAQVAAQEGEAHYWISVDSEGWLCLSAEQIISLPVDPDAESKTGCFIDHDHLHFRERICDKGQ